MLLTPHTKEEEEEDISWAQCTNPSCQSGVEEEEEKGWLVVDEETRKRVKDDDNWECVVCSQLSKKKTPVLTMYQAFCEQMKRYTETNAKEQPVQETVSEFTPEFFDASSAAWMQNKVRVLDDNGFTSKAHSPSVLFFL